MRRGCATSKLLMPTVFLDTNILLYRLDKSQPDKRQTAIDLIREHVGEIAISVQVLQEFYVNATRKLGLTPSNARSDVELWSQRRVIQTTPQLVLSAIDSSERYRISFWDALIVESAVAADATVLFTEDMNNGQSIRGVRIVNPFSLVPMRQE
jgi:predicted nucleic acid-binding protein